MFQKNDIINATITFREKYKSLRGFFETCQQDLFTIDKMPSSSKMNPVEKYSNLGADEAWEQFKEKLSEYSKLSRMLEYIDTSAHEELQAQKMLMTKIKWHLQCINPPLLTESRLKNRDKVQVTINHILTEIKMLEDNPRLFIPSASTLLKQLPPLLPQAFRKQDETPVSAPLRKDLGNLFKEYQKKADTRYFQPLYDECLRQGKNYAVNKVVNLFQDETITREALAEALPAFKLEVRQTLLP